MLENTEKELKALAPKLESYLKSMIQARGLVDSGNLLKSISVSFVDKGGSLELSVEAADYIKYVDDGKLLEDFLNYAKTEISETIVKSAQKDLINKFKINK